MIKQWNGGRGGLINPVCEIKKKRGIFEEIIKYNVCGFFVIKNHIVMMMMETDAL